jgi:hypothetical protein
MSSDQEETVPIRMMSASVDPCTHGSNECQRSWASVTSEGKRRTCRVPFLPATVYHEQESRNIGDLTLKGCVVRAIFVL